MKLPRRDERGAVAIVTGVCFLAFLVGVAAFTVDIGMQRVVRRDMQALADIVALDLGRQLNDKKAEDLLASADFKNAFRYSVGRNDEGVVGERPELEAHVGLWDDGEFTPLGSVTYRAGDASTSTGDTASPSAGVPNAVRVMASGSVGFAFVSGHGEARRQAVVSRGTPGVCFSVGTKTLTLNTDESALGPLLDNILRVNLSAVGYEGLVDLKGVSVPIADVMAQLNVGSPDQLATTYVRLAEFQAAVVEAMRGRGDTASSEILEALELGVPGIEFSLGDILALGTGGVDGLTADVNVLDLFGAAVIAANGDHAIQAGLQGVGSISIIEPPKVACGGRGTQASSAQIRVNINTSLPATPVLGLVNSTAINLILAVGRATATINGDLTCLPDTVPFTVSTGAVAIEPPAAGKFGQILLRITLAKFLGYIPGLGLILRLALQALGLSTVALDARVDGNVGAKTESRTVVYPDPPAAPPSVVFPENGVEETLTLTGTGLQINQADSGAVIGLLGALLNPTLTALTSGLLVPVVNSLNGILTPMLNLLLDFLGVGLGVAEVDMLGRPVCNNVKLVL